MRSLSIILLLISNVLHAQDSLSKIPFEGMDLSWINGQNRQKNFPLILKEKATGETILTGVAYLDSYFNYNLANTIDNTHTGSSTIGRHKELR